MSRKTILTVVGVLAAVLAFLKGQFGLEMDVTAVTGGIAAVLLYVLFEGKLDVKRMAAQPKKWTDPKFLIASVTAILPVLNQQLGINLPAETVVSVLTAIMTILFKVDFKKAQ